MLGGWAVVLALALSLAMGCGNQAAIEKARAQVDRIAEDTAANAARGLVRGTVEGVRDSIRESWPRKRQDDGQSEIDAGEHASGASLDETEESSTP
jgi:hypothetical protein